MSSKTAAVVILNMSNLTLNWMEIQMEMEQMELLNVAY